MPGIVLFNRRWAVGSDDFIIPGVFNLVLHIIWLIVLSIILGTVDFGRMTPCVSDLHEHVLGYIVILTGCIVVEACISWVSMRGTILYTEPRSSMQYLLYVRLGILFVEIGWLIVGGVWIGKHYNTCPTGVAKEAILGIVVCNWVVMLFVVIAIWCTFDAAGRSWVKMKKYQRNIRDSRNKRFYRRSGSSQRNWRHRKALQQYRDSWNKRCRLLFCCMNKGDQERNTFTEIAKLLSEFFRDLDVVPSDVVAGLVLLRKYQKAQREEIIGRKSGIFQFLSGVAITSNTRFLDINNENVVRDFSTVIHYMRYAVAAYGWPMYVMISPLAAMCTMCFRMKCCCLPVRKRSSRLRDSASIVHDNCCHCNYTALHRICADYDMDVIFVTYHVEVGETPFFVAVDHAMKSVVVSIRGTLSMQDIVTDLNAEAEPIPTEPIQDAWYGHKGMTQAAEYIRRKLIDDQLLFRAFNHSIERGSIDYQLNLVGHSLGAGTAAILAILLRNEYPTLHCFAFSPPGGLLSLPLAEYTKSFITSVVVGKDLVPRIGLHQMEQLRTDLIDAIKRSCDSKWKVIASGVMCCCCPEKSIECSADLIQISDRSDVSTHPSDSSISLSVHQPLYPPGKIIHIVRNHPPRQRGSLYRPQPVYQAIWADTTDFDEVLISPVMIQDHMPDNVLDALEKVLVNTGPPKPQRNLSTRNLILSGPDHSEDFPQDRSPSGRLILETSFTDSNSGQNYSLIRQHGDRINRWNKENGSCLSNSPVGRNDIFAPLASPETMSDISSLSSVRSSARSSYCDTSDCSANNDDAAAAEKTEWNVVVVVVDESSTTRPVPSCDQTNNNDESEVNYCVEIEATVEVEPKSVDSECPSSDTNSSGKDGQSKPNSILKLAKSERKRVTFDLASDSVRSIPSETLSNGANFSNRSEYDGRGGDSQLDRSSDGRHPDKLHHSHSENAISGIDYLKVEMPPSLKRSNEEMNLTELDDGAYVFDGGVISGDKSNSVESLPIVAPPSSFS